MPFDRGSITFSMFDISGDIPENFAEMFAASKAGTLDSVTAEPQFGWVTGQHLLDTNIDEGSAQCGGCYYLTLRQAVRKIPASLLNALCRREEQAFLAANPGRDYVSGKDKKRIKEDVIERHINKMPPALSGVSMVLEPHDKYLYLGTGSQSQIDLFIENFYRITKMEPLQLTPALILEREFQTTCAAFPALKLNDSPAAPADPQVGRDFLTWLLYYSESVGKLTFENNEFDIMLEAPLVLLDEFARGTNPDEGAAIVQAVTRYLDRQNAVTVLATHYDRVARWGSTHYQVIGLKELDLDALRKELAGRTDDVGVELISRHMNYGLYRVEGTGDCPRDAVNICRLLDMKAEILDGIDEILTGQ